MDYYLGGIILLPYNFSISGWIACEGQILQISQNQALFSLIGNTYGGNGNTTFALPDLRNASPLPGMRYFISTHGLYPPRT
ncbi:tail fiber protein [Ruminiclostridium herbifermentans]|uniref:Tail fiber protein n=1 Tax=Ruminiclostridium herbifermentans TaxID=2488810 RepID=A0A4U7JDN8_9FIRM|nr:tail fiber protein [Ruminiclostridium herbifermentans]QNU67726.1 tail fiber protein [Ruminiclostridium herbifermentans]